MIIHSRIASSPSGLGIFLWAYMTNRHMRPEIWRAFCGPVCHGGPRAVDRSYLIIPVELDLRRAMRWAYRLALVFYTTFFAKGECL